ncbi:MAG: CaiB/BaiF CoA-transferase family protein [Hyphomicrobiales bacterium]|nr:CaiB/BaiF CoA-transferase family protein [Hyphomicrobiales bacterium]MCY4048423.1 CaiB/BaiF CoA-transferase family protein [Hyphomicrobiales bacterium]MCY4052620.1 CaiB/BaiF CoA-transferase family protein [Hyphomicrobiales bacterium]
MNEPPLKGLRVVELARVLAGPWLGQILADLGADVVKVESPAGDDTRRFGPPFLEGADGKNLDAAYFHSCNHSKRSIILDFRKDEDREAAHRLVGRADVLIENFRPGGLRKYGLDYESVREKNPRLVYCSITGFGQDGPYASHPGYDLLIQAMGGVMDITGEADGPPCKVGVAFADIFTGLYGVIGVQAALAQRERTGRGERIDMSLLDCMVAVLANQAMNYLVTGIPPKRFGNEHPNIVPYQSFEARDGYVVIAVANDPQFKCLCEILGVPELSSDERFATNPARVLNRKELLDILTGKIAKWSREALLEALKEKIPAGPISDLEEVFDNAQVRHRGMRVGVPDENVSGGKLDLLRLPILFSGMEIPPMRVAPGLGEHTNEILDEIGMENGGRAAG